MIINDSNLYKKLSEGALNTAKKEMSWENICKEYKKIIEEII